MLAHPCVVQTLGVFLIVPTGAAVESRLPGNFVIERLAGLVRVIEFLGENERFLEFHNVEEALSEALDRVVARGMAE